LSQSSGREKILYPQDMTLMITGLMLKYLKLFNITQIKFHLYHVLKAMMS